MNNKMDGFYVNKQVDCFYNKLEKVNETLDKLAGYGSDEKIKNLLEYESTLNKNIKLLQNYKSSLDPNSKFYKTFNCLSVEYNNTRSRLHKIVNDLQESLI